MLFELLYSVHLKWSHGLILGIERTEMRHLHTSMPHIPHTTRGGGRGGGATREGEEEGSVATEIAPRSSRSLRSSMTQSFHYYGDRHRPPLSVRNSLVLGERRVSLRDDRLPVFTDSTSSHSSGSIQHGMAPSGEARAGTTTTIPREPEPDQVSVVYTDSGIQTAHSGDYRNPLSSLFKEHHNHHDNQTQQ